MCYWVSAGVTMSGTSICRYISPLSTTGVAVRLPLLLLNVSPAYAEAVPMAYLDARLRGQDDSDATMRICPENLFYGLALAPAARLAGRGSGRGSNRPSPSRRSVSAFASSVPF